MLPRTAPPPAAAARTPLADAVAARAALPATSFHVPGHKGRPPPVSTVVVNPVAAALAAAAAVDTTELAGLDVLASPTGAIAAAAAAAAAAYGVPACRYLVNGATAGVAAAVVAACGAGSAAPPRTLLATRAAHQSVVAGAVTAGCRLAWIAPECAAAAWGGCAHPPTAAAVAQALTAAAAAGHDVGAVLIVSPTYFGAVADVQAIAAVCAAAAVPLIVDAAHGAHFGLDPAFPPAPAAAGAALSIAGAHKTLAVLTQAAVLQVGASASAALVDRVDAALTLLQSSSPSYLLMASLDAGVAAGAAPGAWAQPLAAAAAASAAVASTPGWHLLSRDAAETARMFDPLRLTLRHAALTGRRAAAALEAAGAVPEMATDAAVVLALGAGSRAGDGAALATALAAVSAAAAALPPRPLPAIPPPSWSAFDAPLTPRDALLGPATRVRLQAAVGRIAAEAITPYPPGVPALVPGERVTRDVVDGIAAVLAGGGRLVAGDASGGSVAVVR